MLTMTLENLLNRGLPRSPRARQLCAALAGRSVAIVVPDLVRLRVTSTGQTLAVTRDDAAADATIAGGLLSLLALTGDSAQAVIQRGDVSITGDSERAQCFRELAQLLRPDPEEELSLLIGDVPA
ncbi:MAG: SCP2 sterol-binding domain-containing protein, partial [Steroidobacteraceae bacterium]